MLTVKCPTCGGTGEVPNQKSLGAELRKLREKAGLSGRQVARRMHISAPYLSDLELGRRHWTPKLVMLFKLTLKTYDQS